MVVAKSRWVAHRPQRLFAFVILSLVGFCDLKVGDEVTRMLAGTIPMPLRVTAVDQHLIHCGPWTFDRATGVEEDSDLNWGVKYGVTGSYLVSDAKD